MRMRLQKAVIAFAVVLSVSACTPAGRRGANLDAEVESCQRPVPVDHRGPFSNCELRALGVSVTSDRPQYEELSFEQRLAAFSALSADHARQQAAQTQQQAAQAVPFYRMPSTPAAVTCNGTNFDPIFSMNCH